MASDYFGVEVETPCLQWCCSPGSVSLCSVCQCFRPYKGCLPIRLQSTDDPIVLFCLFSWHEGHDQSPPEPSNMHWQMRCHPKLEQITSFLMLQILIMSPPIAASVSESGVWINVLTASAVCLHMCDDIVRFVVGIRLGAALCLPHHCVHCVADVDTLATHQLSCKKCRGRLTCHGSVNDIIHHSLLSAKKNSCSIRTCLFVEIHWKEPRWNVYSPMVWSYGMLLTLLATFLHNFYNLIKDCSFWSWCCSCEGQELDGCSNLGLTYLWL